MRRKDVVNPAQPDKQPESTKFKSQQTQSYRLTTGVGEGEVNFDNMQCQTEYSEGSSSDD